MKAAKDRDRFEKLAAKKGEAVAAAAAAEHQRKAADAAKKGPAVRGTLFYKVTVKVGMPASLYCFNLAS